MIRHVVLFKHKPDVTDDERSRWIESVRQLAREIPQVRALTIGTDVMRMPRSYDVALVADFETLDDLKTYEIHPAHVVVAGVSRTLAEHICSVDFEY